MTHLLRVYFSLLLIAGQGNLSPVAAQHDAEFWSRLIIQAETSHLSESQAYRVRAARMALSAQEKLRLPTMSLSADLPGITRQIEPILQDDGTQAFIPRSLSYSSGFLSVRQIIPSSGTEISLSSGAFRTGDFQGEMSHWQTQPVVIRVKQPLFRESAFLTREREFDRAVSMAEAQQTLSLHAALSALFHDWWTIRLGEYQLQDARWKAAQLDSMFRISQMLWEEGQRTYSDLAQIRKEAGYSQLDLEIAEARQQSLLGKFDLIWGIPWEDLPDWNPSGLPPEILPASVPFVSAERRLIHLDIESQEDQIRRMKQENLPEVSIDALLGLNQTGETLTDAVRDPLLSQYFSISLQHTLLDWGRNTAMREAEQLILQSMVAEEADLRQKENADQLAGRIMLQDLRSVYTSRCDMLSRAKEHLFWMEEQYNSGRTGLRSLFEAQNDYQLLQAQQLSLEAECWQLWLELFLQHPDAFNQLTIGGKDG